MLHENCLHKAHKLLDAADRAFDADENEREGSRLMWEATIAGISAVAISRGWAHETIEDVKLTVHRLDELGEQPRSYIFSNMHSTKFSLAKIFLEHAETADDDWEWPEFRWSEPEFHDSRKSLKLYMDTLEKLAARDATVLR